MLTDVNVSQSVADRAYSMMFDVEALKRRKDEENLVAWVARVNGYTDCMVWATTRRTGGEVIIAYHTLPRPGAYIVDRGRVIGKVKG